MSICLQDLIYIMAQVVEKTHFQKYFNLEGYIEGSKIQIKYSSLQNLKAGGGEFMTAEPFEGERECLKATRTQGIHFLFLTFKELGANEEEYH